MSPTIIATTAAMAFLLIHQYMPLTLGCSAAGCAPAPNAAPAIDRASSCSSVPPMKGTLVPPVKGALVPPMKGT